MPSLAALGYILLAADLIGKAITNPDPDPAPAPNRSAGYGVVRVRQPQIPQNFNPTGPIVEISTGSVFGLRPGGPAEQPLISVPVGGFTRAAKGKTYRNVPDLGERITLIKQAIRQGAVDPRVRKLAQTVLGARCPGKPGGWCVREKDWKGEADALFRFARQQIRYTKDSAFADVFVTPQRTLFDRPTAAHGSIGDCDDYAITLGALLASVGHDVVLRVGAVKVDGGKPGEPNHIWLVDRLPEGGAVTARGSRMYPLDASVDVAPGWQAPRARLWRVWDYPVSGR